MSLGPCNRHRGSWLKRRRLEGTENIRLRILPHISKPRQSHARLVSKMRQWLFPSIPLKMNYSPTILLLNTVPSELLTSMINAPHNFFFLLRRFGPTQTMTSSILRCTDHTQRRTTIGRTPLDEWLARRRDLYLTTHTLIRQTSMPSAEIEPTTPAHERPQTHALEVAATGTSPYTGYFTTLGHNCRRWFPRSMWSKKNI